MTILIRGRRAAKLRSPPGRSALCRFLQPQRLGTDHFGFLYQGDLTALCAELRAKGVAFPVELKNGVNGSLLCYVAAPDGGQPSS